MLAGPAAPSLRKFFNLYEGKKQILELQGAPWLDNMGDQAFVTECEKLLNDASALTTKALGKKLLSMSRMQLLNGYFLQTNSCLLQGAELELFSKRLAEYLTLAKANDFNSPKRYRMNIQQLIWRVSSIDIGDTKPWHKSPVVQKILTDPIAMIHRQQTRAL